MRKWILTVVSILLFACGGGSDSEISATTASAGQVLVQTSGGDFTAIPDIPFDYELQPGAATASGRLPAQIFAGEVLAFNGQPVSANTDIQCNGTEHNPAFIVGGTLSGDNDVFNVNGSWCFFIDTVFDNIQVRTTGGDHHVFRNIEVRNLAGKNGMSLSGTNIVLTDSEIHHNQGDDRHGVFVGSGSDGIWIIGNYIHHNGGDGFQACHGCSANPPQNVYIGNNVFHSDRENAVDFKWINNVIVEGNVMYAYVTAPAGVLWCFDDGSSCRVFSSGSDGSAIVIGSDGTPENLRILNNEIYDSNNAVRVEEGIAVTVDGNDLHDIDGQCLQLDKQGFNLVFAGNSCNNANRGIFQNWRVNFSLDVDDNTWENIGGPVIEYETRSVCDASMLTNNSFTSTGAVICGNQTATTEAEINSLPGAGGNVVN